MRGSASHIQTSGGLELLRVLVRSPRTLTASESLADEATECWPRRCTGGIACDGRREAPIKSAWCCTGAAGAVIRSGDKARPPCIIRPARQTLRNQSTWRTLSSHSMCRARYGRTTCRADLILAGVVLIIAFLRPRSHMRPASIWQARARGLRHAQADAVCQRGAPPRQTKQDAANNTKGLGYITTHLLLGTALSTSCDSVPAVCRNRTRRRHLLHGGAQPSGKHYMREAPSRGVPDSCLGAHTAYERETDPSGRRYWWFGRSGGTCQANNGRAGKR